MQGFTKKEQKYLRQLEIQKLTVFDMKHLIQEHRNGKYKHLKGSTITAHIKMLKHRINEVKLENLINS